MTETSYQIQTGWALLAWLTLGPIVNAQADDGSDLYKAKACSTCHGAQPHQPLLPLYPKLSGQSSDYLLQQMKDIRDGHRSNGLSATMKVMVGNITDEEFELIAEWLAGQ